MIDIRTRSTKWTTTDTNCNRTMSNIDNFFFFTVITRLPCNTQSKVCTYSLDKVREKNLNNDNEFTLITIRKLMSEVISIGLWHTIPLTILSGWPFLSLTIEWFKSTNPKLVFSNYISLYIFKSWLKSMYSRIFYFIF